MNTFKTSKGTELPLMDIRGKAYLQVAHRLVWFREEHPDWGITTEFLSITASAATAKATISHDGKIIATAHKSETSQGFPDFLEKAETGAIGRALALCGYGTQFTDDLAEGDRLADAPIGGASLSGSIAYRDAPLRSPIMDLGDTYVIPFGKKFKDRTLQSIADKEGIAELISYSEWIQADSIKRNKPIEGRAEEFIAQVEAFLKASASLREEDIPF